MIDKQFSIQLQKAYEDFLRRTIRKEDFQPVRLRGGKKKPETTQALHQAIQGFLTYEKKEGQPGWNITWEHWQSRKLGKQRWPVDIIIATEEDLVFILKNKTERRMVNGNKPLFCLSISIIALLSLFCLALNKSIKAFSVSHNNK